MGLGKKIGCKQNRVEAFQAWNKALHVNTTDRVYPHYESRGVSAAVRSKNVAFCTVG
jgi:hypothetical protein